MFPPKNQKIVITVELFSEPSDDVIKEYIQAINDDLNSKIRLFSGDMFHNRNINSLVNYLNMNDDANTITTDVIQHQRIQKIIDDAIEMINNKQHHIL